MSKTPRSMLLVTLCVLATAAFAGCIGSDAETTSALQIESQEEATAGERVRFAAKAQNNSTEADFVFDFGDGTSQTVKGVGAAEAEHAYDLGGRYGVTVSMLAGNETIALADAAIHIVERHAHDQKFVATGPLPNQTAAQQWSVPIGANATSLLANLSLENTMPIGQSVVEIQVVDADGEVLATQEFTLDEGGSSTVLMEADLAGGESVALRAIARAGSASIEGESTVLF